MKLLRFEYAALRTIDDFFSIIQGCMTSNTSAQTSREVYQSEKVVNELTVQIYTIWSLVEEVSLRVTLWFMVDVIS